MQSLILACDVGGYVLPKGLSMRFSGDVSCSPYICEEEGYADLEAVRTSIIYGKSIDHISYLNVLNYLNF